MTRVMYHRFMVLVEIDTVWKSYPSRAGLHTELQRVVDNVSFSIVAGETLGLVGESGSGKTTVARMILGLVQPTSGSIHINGINVAQASRAQLKALRRQMQPVFQDPYAALNPRMKVFDIVTEPWVIHGIDITADPNQRHDRRALLRIRAGELLREVGLDDSALGR